MARRRLTRKEIVQEDPIHAFINQVFEFVVENKNLLLSLLLGAVAVAIGVYFWTDRLAANNAEIQLAFSQAQEMFQAGIGEPPPVSPGTLPDPGLRYKTKEEKFNAALTAFSELAAKAKGDPIGLYARYYKALSLKGLGRHDEYVKAMEELAREKNSPVMTDLAAYCLGDDYLAQGEIKKAQEFFELVLADENSHFPKDSILNQLAEYHEKHHDPAQAKIFLQRLINEYPDSFLKSKAETKLAELNAAEKN